MLSSDILFLLTPLLPYYYAYFVVSLLASLVSLFKYTGLFNHEGGRREVTITTTLTLPGLFRICCNLIKASYRVN